MTPAPLRPRGRPRRGATVATATVTLRLEPDDMARLKAAAAEAGMPPATLVHRMVLAALDARGEPLSAPDPAAPR